MTAARFSHRLREKSAHAESSLPAACALFLFLLFGAAGCEQSSRVKQPVVVGTTIDDPDIRSLFAQLYQQALELSESSERRGRLAMAYEANGFIEEAIDSYRQAEHLDPGSPRWPYARSRLHALRGEQEEALQAVSTALANDGSYTPAWLYRGTWLLDGGYYQEALEAFEKARSIGGGLPADTGRARAMLHLEQPEEATLILEALVIESGHPYVHRVLGQAYRALGREEESDIALARGKVVVPLWWPDPWAENKNVFLVGWGGRMNHASDLIKRGDLGAAIGILEGLQETDPDDVELITNLGYAYAMSGRLTDAVGLTKRGLSVNPDNPTFHLSLAALYHQQGESDRAILSQRRAIKLSPPRGDAFRQLGIMYMQTGDYSRAAEALDTALELGVAGVEQVHYMRGIVAGSMQQWPEAVSQFQQATETDIAFSLAYIQLARSLAELGRFEEADNALDWAEKLGGQDGELATVRAGVKRLRSR